MLKLPLIPQGGKARSVKLVGILPNVQLPNKDRFNKATYNLCVHVFSEETFQITNDKIRQFSFSLSRDSHLQKTICIMFTYGTCVQWGYRGDCAIWRDECIQFLKNVLRSPERMMLSLKTPNIPTKNISWYTLEFRL